MGTGVGRIEQEFILTAVQDRHIAVVVHGTRKEGEGHISSFTDNEVEIELTEPLAVVLNETLRVFFSYFGHVMTFTATVKRTGTEKLVLSYPLGIYKHLQRKYERVTPPGDVQVSFQLENTKVELNFPKTEEYNPAEQPEVSEQFKPDSLLDLMRKFRESLEDRCTANTITMFRDRGPATVDEKIISRTARTLYIPSTQSGFPVSRTV